MDVKQQLLKMKRFFDEEIEHYKGPDPLKIRCKFFNWLENYSKEDIADIYLPLLEETLKLFMDHPAYKQDLRFIRLWLNYSVTQPNPAEVMKNMHSRGLGTECSLLYSTWAEQLIKMGSFATADSVFKLGLTANLQTKSDLQKQYDEFLKDIGLRVIMGKLQCPKCGTTFQSSGDNNVGANINDNGACSSENVANWEWNPLKVGEKDDFECPLAYFEEDDPTKIRMYPKHKVYPGNGQEFSLEEIRAAEYELRYKEEEEREKARAAEERERAAAEERERAAAEERERAAAEERERAAAEARAKEEEARKKEAEAFKAPVQATIPAFTPKMLSLPKRPRENNSPAAVLPKKFVGAGVISNWAQEMDSLLANSTTFTVHTKEAMNVVQDMWSSPTPAKINTRPVLKSENLPETTAAVPSKPQFEIYTEEDPAPVIPSQKTPFQIYDENINSNQKKPLRSASAPRKPMEVHDDENAPPNQDILTLQRQSALKPKTPIEIYNDNQAFKTPDGKINPVMGFPNPKNRLQLFKDDDEADLADKLESQARIRPPMFNVQDKNDDFSDITCNTKAFDFILTSSTPLHKTQKPPNNFIRNEEPSKLKEQTNLSVILEQSKDRSGNSTTSSLAPNNKSTKSVAVLQTVPETFDPFNSEIIEELLKKVGFPKAQYATNYNVKSANLPTGTKTMKLGSESYSIIGEIGKGAYAKVIKASNSLGNIMALKIEKPACKWEFYIAKEIQLRVPPKMAPAFMDISSAYIYNNGSILETHFAKYGTLITNINTFKEKSGKPLDLGVILHFSLELIDIVEYLHKCKIIHADLKSDNIVLRELPSNDEIEPCLQLIDFGRCIDMSLLPPDTKFNTVFKVEDNKCIEMKENKSWTYQIDLQGLASIFHVLLFSEHMKIHKKNNIWQLQKTVPRHLKREVWNPIFEALLNVNPARDLPFNFNPMRQSIMKVLNSSLSSCLNQHIKIFSSHISGK